MTRWATPIAAVAAMAIAVAGCGSSKKSSAGSATSNSSSSAASTKPAGPAVALRKVSFGTILTGPNGHTLYLFEKDKGIKSRCNGACAAAWMPFTAQGKPSAGAGLKPALFGTTMRSDGSTQVTYGGHPLYYYIRDKAAGQTTGEGSKAFGAEWYAVGANGKKVENEGS